jgi:hypothetical protein
MGLSTNFFLNAKDIISVIIGLWIITLIVYMLNNKIKKNSNQEIYNESKFRKIYIFIFQLNFKILEGNLNFFLIYFYLQITNMSK